MTEADEFKAMLEDYRQTAAYFHALHDVRFKLLAFLPVFTGGAIALASGSGPLLIVISLVGILTTIGLTAYDQRNTIIYDRMVRRGPLLERKLRFYCVPNPAPKAADWIGTFGNRPPRRDVQDIFPDLSLRKGGRIAEFSLIWHDSGLAVIYSASLAAWVHTFVYALGAGHFAFILSIPVFLADYSLLMRLARMNDDENKAMEDTAGRHDPEVARDRAC